MSDHENRVDAAEPLLDELVRLCESEDSLSEQGLHKIIERHGLTPNSNHLNISDYDFFSWACVNSSVNEGIIRFLLEYFPDAAGHTDDEEWTPLHCACTNKNVTRDIIQLLIDAAPESVGSANFDECLPIHYLCENSGMDEKEAIGILKLLLDKCPESIRKADCLGLIPLQLTARNASPAFCRILTEAYCANCGTAEIDEIKLKDCDKCDLARYCSDECQKDHLEKHEEICNERADELRDEILFRQPESSYRGECPICFLPMLLDTHRSVMKFCCCKMICDGCDLFIPPKKVRGEEQRLENRCPFCRTLVPQNKEDLTKQCEKRAEANDPVAVRFMGCFHYEEGDYDSALQYWTRAATLGDAIAHNKLAKLYRKGEGVEKDEERVVYHLEEAAIAGHPDARYILGLLEWNYEWIDRAVKHWIIASYLGHDKSIQQLKECYKVGYVSKDDFAAALYAHQAALDATKSPQRESAKEVYRDIYEKYL